jgi:hypothetical protein
MSEEWRKPPSELNFREGCLREPCFREPCFREPCAPPEEEDGGDGGDGEFFFVELDGDSSSINCGSDVSLDNIHAAAFTVDLWLRGYSFANWPDLVSKTSAGYNVGWYLDAYPGGQLYFDIEYATIGWAESNEALSLATWHHATAVFDGADCWLAIDGTWCTYASRQTVAGLPKSDALQNLLIGSGTGGSWFDGDISWVRISSGQRYAHGVNFAAPGRCPPPAVDGTTVELWAMDEGAGAVTAASVVSPANDGAMTDCVWHPCV